jgi:adenylosuccinate synthase
LAGYLAIQNEYDVVITSNMPNAGHTFIDAEGNKYIHHVLGNGCVSPKIQYVMVGPGSVFDPDQLMKEWDHAALSGNVFEVVIHEAAVVLQDEHRNAEEVMWGETNSIGSTQQGSAAAMVAKIGRNDCPVIARDVLKDHDLYQYTCNDGDWNAIVNNARNILIEGSQGYSLGIDAGFYPFCTSRDCTPARIMSDCRVPLPMLRNVYGSARVHPIRVGGTSGPGYSDQNEIRWEDIKVEPERTTTTNRERRIFTFSPEQMRKAIFACAPDYVFLNFCNYDPEFARSLVDEINDTLEIIVGGGARVKCTGWGPTVDMIQEEDI